MWPPHGAIPTEYLMYALAEIAINAYCEEQRETVAACDTLFRHLGWIGRSNLQSIIEVATDGLSVPEGNIPFTEPLSDPVRRMITPLVLEAVEVQSEMVAETIFTLCPDCHEKHDLEILDERDFGDGHTMVRTRCRGCGTTSSIAGQNIKDVLRFLGTSTPVEQDT